MANDKIDIRAKLHNVMGHLRFNEIVQAFELVQKMSAQMDEEYYEPRKRLFDGHEYYHRNLGTCTLIHCHPHDGACLVMERWVDDEQEYFTCEKSDLIFEENGKRFRVTGYTAEGEEIQTPWNPFPATPLPLKSLSAKICKGNVKILEHDKNKGICESCGSRKQTMFGGLPKVCTNLVEEK